MSKPAVIRISAKCSDLFFADLLDQNLKSVGLQYDGYVPKFFPGEHYGDYVMLDIELATGKILNWKPPTQQQLRVEFQPTKLC